MKNFWIILLIILSLFVWKFTKTYETFVQPKTNWVETLKCLGFNNDDLNKFQKHLSSGEDPMIVLNKLIYMAGQKDIDDKRIFDCLMGEQKYE